MIRRIRELHFPGLIALTTLVVWGASGCWVPLSQGRAMEADIVDLKVGLEEQKREIERDRQRMKQEQEEALARVNESMEALNRAARKTGADLGVELEQAMTELARLRGLIEEIQVALRLDDESATQSLSEIDRKLTDALSRIGVLEEAAKVQATALPTDKDEFYRLAKSVLDEGDTARARALFTDFLSRWSDDPLAANAQYWLGESYYAERRYREAITAFVVVTNRHGKSDKVPDALLKIGFSFIELKQPAQGKDFLEEVVKAHPKSPAAKIARERLAKL